MKKNIYALLLLVGAFASCKKSGYDPKLANPDERLSALAATYMTQLTGAQFGWKAYLHTGGDEVYTFALKFTEDNRVTMSTDINASTITGATSSYRLKSLQRPTLLFDTYSYLHLLEDPTPEVAGGGAGVGRKSDFEFRFESTSADTMKFEGTFNKSKLTLVRSKSQAETDAAVTQVNQVAAMLNNILTYFKVINYDGVDYEAKVDATNKRFTIKTPTGPQTSLYYVRDNIIELLTPFTLGTTKVTTIGTYSYDGTKFVGTASGKPLTIKGATAPLVFDATAAKKWYDQMFLNFNGCWVSDAAFHVNGVDDFCKFRSVTGYQTLWYGGPAVFGGTSEGLIPYTGAFPAGTPYALNKVPFTINNGIARFILTASGGTYTGTGAMAVAMTSARLILFGGATTNSAQDWYLIPTSTDGKSYDMVRASDALAWISWRPR